VKMSSFSARAKIISLIERPLKKIGIQSKHVTKENVFEFSSKTTKLLLIFRKIYVQNIH